MMSPNRSILDDEETEGDNDTAAALAGSFSRINNPSPIARQNSDGNNTMDDSLFRGLSDTESKASMKEPEKLDILVLKAELDLANAQIARLHEEIAKRSVDNDVPDILNVPDLHNYDNRMVNVRMLNGENFITEWNDLTPPLPPPPDHGLYSPIVRAVLEQWTNDGSLHESLISWIERVLTGNELESIPPLTISSLDHQVRDGFTMHVLPLILRRADIHVSVQTRAHRRTTYDLNVIVNPKMDQTSRSGSNLLDGVDAQEALTDLDKYVEDWSESLGQQMDRKSVTHSTATAHASNSSLHQHSIYRNNRNDSPSVGNFAGTLKTSTSNDLSDALHQQHGIMTALGGALGGLLSRRKHLSSTPNRKIPAALRAQLDLTSSPIPSSDRLEEDDQPYHRVVSAPPGRIGITFVEFRGHAMVSDVSTHSPLCGWVFPSDILIAIDEVPVSGMRVRDIITVLTNRKNRQRALRVISSHAMNEFTLNNSHLNDPS